MKTQWEYDLVEKPFCEQLKVMGWEWMQGDTDVPELTERVSFREVLLKDRLRAALRKINPGPDGQPWLDDGRIERAILDLERLGEYRLMEANQAATSLLIKGTVTEGLPGWNHGREQAVRYIDFDNWPNNDFVVINQFKVELTSQRGHVIPDALLFVNGIPLVVAEFKSPGVESPLGQAINQLLRYSNQRKELYPTRFTDDEGVERLFHYNQLLLASNFFEARARPQRILRESTPDIVFAMLQKYQEVERNAVGGEKVAMTIRRKVKKPGKHSRLVEREETFAEDIRFEEFPTLNESEEVLVLVDEAHRSHSRWLHRNLRRALPNAAIIGFTGTPIWSSRIMVPTSGHASNAFSRESPNHDPRLGPGRACILSCTCARFNPRRLLQTAPYFYC